MADDGPLNELESREPTVEDLRNLCRERNQRGAKYVVLAFLRQWFAQRGEEPPRV
jgi:hypothetical protein